MGCSGKPKGHGSKATQKLWQSLVADIIEEARVAKILSQVPKWPPGEKVALGYSRVSTDEQRILGTSLEAQEKLCEGYFHTNLEQEGYVWKGMLNDETVSATKHRLFERPQGQQILTLRKGDAIIFPVFDRAFRTMRDFVLSTPVLQQLGLRVCLIDFPIDLNTPEGQFMLAIRASTAEFEAKLIAKRMATGQQFRKMQRRPYGKLPLGFRIVGRTATFKGKLAPDWEWRSIAMAAWNEMQQNPGISKLKLSQRCNQTWCRIHRIEFIDSPFAKYPWDAKDISRLEERINRISEIEGSEAWKLMTPKIKLS